MLSQLLERVGRVGLLQFVESRDALARRGAGLARARRRRGLWQRAERSAVLFEASLDHYIVLPSPSTRCSCTRLASERALYSPLRLYLAA